MLRINAFALFTVEIGNFMMDIMRRRNPSAVVPHSVQSGLMGVLDHRLTSAAQEFSDIIGWERAAADCSISIGSQSKSPALKRQTTMRFLLYSKLPFSLLKPFLSIAPLMQFCTHLLPPGVSSCHGCREVDTSQLLYLWDAACSPRENAKFRESWSTDALQSIGNSVISMEANNEANKLICQLSGAKSLLAFFRTRNPFPPS
jgi:hypothetical protein